MMMLRENSEETVHIPVKGGSTMELAMQLSWLANPNPVDLEAIIEYGSYGMRGSAVATDRPLLIGAAETYARFEVSAPLRTEKVSPKAELTSVERAIRPVKYEIKAGSAELDVLPPSDAQLAEDASFAGTQIHQMILSYNFEVATKDDEKLSVIPRVAALHEQLYDSALDSMLWKLETADTGAVIGWGGLIHDSDPLKLRKGKYKVSVLLRHTAPSQLEALKDLPLLLKMDLPKAADCKVFGHRGAASTAGHGEGVKPVSEYWLRRGGQRSLYVAAPTGDLPKWVAPGDSLVGSLLVNKDAKKVSEVKLVYEVPPPKNEKKDDADDDKEEEDKDVDEKKKDEEALEKALLEAKLTRLTSLRTSGASVERYEALSKPLLESNRKHLPLLQEILAWHRKPPKAKDAKEEPKPDPSAIGAAADAMLTPDGPIDTAKLAQFFGVAAEDGADASKEAKEAKKEMDSQRKALRTALYAKAFALAPEKMEFGKEEEGKEKKDSPFVEAVKAMKQWVTKADDLDEGEKDGYACLIAKYELSQGRTAGALSTLHARLKAAPSKKLAGEVADMYKALGWEHWASNAAEKLERDYPKASSPL